MPEEEAFCVLVKLMQDYRLRELFKPTMAELGLCMFQLECMIQVSGIISILNPFSPAPGISRHTSHVTRHTSHVTRHTSHVTRHTRSRLVPGI